MSLKSFLDPASATWEMGGIYALEAAEAHHVRVMRLAPGELLQVVDGSGRTATCQIEAVCADTVELRVENIQESLAHPRVGVVQALAKQDRDLQAVETCVEIGADTFIPWQSDRSIVRWKPERAAKAHQKWVDTVARATKQSRRAFYPTVGQMVTSKQLVSGVQQATDAGATVLICHESAQTPLPAALRAQETKEAVNPGGSTASSAHDAAVGWDADVVLVVGPEGGISESERQAFESAGATLVWLGPNVLRASTAGAVGLVLIRRELGLDSLD